MGDNLIFLEVGVGVQCFYAGRLFQFYQFSIISILKRFVKIQLSRNNV